jgi:hypothetical protein
LGIISACNGQYDSRLAFVTKANGLDRGLLRLLENLLADAFTFQSARIFVTGFLSLAWHCSFSNGRAGVAIAYATSSLGGDRGRE